MLTRKEVALKLGRCISTVRRLEGSRLHPIVNDRGTHLFDSEAVDELAREIQQTGRVLAPEQRTFPEPKGPSWDEYDELGGELDSARAENHRLQLCLNETELRVDASRDDMLRMRAEVHKAAHELDEGCALLLEAETTAIRQVAVDALVTLLEQLEKF